MEVPPVSVVHECYFDTAAEHMNPCMKMMNSAFPSCKDLNAYSTEEHVTVLSIFWGVLKSRV